MESGFQRVSIPDVYPLHYNLVKTVHVLYQNSIIFYLLVIWLFPGLKRVEVLMSWFRKPR